MGYYTNGTRNGGHMVVIYGASDDDDDIFYIDPANGKKIYTNYSNFCNGAVYGGIYDQSVWHYK